MLLALAASINTVLSHKVRLDFGNSDNATAFASDVGTVQGQSLVDGQNLAHSFAQSYLNAAVQGSSAAFDAMLHVNADGSEFVQCIVG